MRARLSNFLQDPSGVNSSGRLFAAYLVTVGILAFYAGLMYSPAAAYAASFTDKCFMYGSIFYGSAKGYDVFKGVGAKIQAMLGTPAPTPAPAAEAPADS